jgi:hypothetical protein
MQISKLNNCTLCTFYNDPQSPPPKLLTAVHITPCNEPLVRHIAVMKLSKHIKTEHSSTNAALERQGRDLNMDQRVAPYLNERKPLGLPPARIGLVNYPMVNTLYHASIYYFPLITE